MQIVSSQRVYSIKMNIPLREVYNVTLGAGVVKIGFKFASLISDVDLKRVLVRVLKCDHRAFEIKTKVFENFETFIEYKN